MLRIDRRWIVLMGCAGLFGCDETDPDYESAATRQVGDYVSGQLQKLTQASEALQKAAPAADSDGWNAKDDAEAVKAMRKAWAEARTAYEHVEGSIAVLFEELDVATDERYDGFIEEAADDNLFDDEGVIGVHAIERILWADAHPDRVVKFESKLPGYVAAAFPSTKEEAEQFKNALCARLVKDTRKMRDDLKSVGTLDSTSAFWGMIGSMEEQSEKTTKAASGEDESRYAQNTLDDMRANLAGARAVFDAFQPWIEAEAGAKKSDEIADGLDAIEKAYAANKGAALPEVPEKFNPDEPSDEDLKTPYGKLWQLLGDETDPNSKDSLVSKMAASADAMHIPGIAD